MPLADYQEPEGHRVRLGVVLGESEFVYALFSHGPWFGFNGVQALCVLPDRFVVVQDGLALNRGRILHDLSRRQVTDIHSKVRERPAARVVLTASLAGRPLRYVSKYKGALAVVDALRGH